MFFGGLGGGVAFLVLPDVSPAVEASALRDLPGIVRADPRIAAVGTVNFAGRYSDQLENRALLTMPALAVLAGGFVLTIVLPTRCLPTTDPVAPSPESQDRWNQPPGTNLHRAQREQL